MKRHLSRALILVMAIVLISGLIPVASANSEDAMVAQALTRDPGRLNTSSDLSDALLQMNARAGGELDLLLSSFMDSRYNFVYPDWFGGAYINENQQAVVLVTRLDGRIMSHVMEVTGNQNILFKEVEHSRAQLRAAREEFHGVFGDPSLRYLVSTMALDCFNNNILVGIVLDDLSMSTPLVQESYFVGNSVMASTEENLEHMLVNALQERTARGRSNIDMGMFAFEFLTERVRIEPPSEFYMELQPEFQRNAIQMQPPLQPQPPQTPQPPQQPQPHPQIQPGSRIGIRVGNTNWFEPTASLGYMASWTNNAGVTRLGFVASGHVFQRANLNNNLATNRVYCIETFKPIGYVRTRVLRNNDVHDMAFIEITNPDVEVSNSIRYTTPTISQQDTFAEAAVQGRILKSGYRTRATQGRILNTSAEVRMDFSSLGLPEIMLHDLIQSTNVMDIGDSGSIVFDPNGNVFGIAVGFNANTGRMWTTKATNIQDLGITPVTTFSAPPDDPPSDPPPAHIPGDVNGDGVVSGIDVLLIRLHLAGFDVDINLTAADVNRDGRVSGIDVLLIRLYLAGFDVVLR